MPKMSMLRKQVVTIFKSRRFVFFSSITETQTKSVPEPDEISNVTEEVVDLARQTNLEVDSDDVQELLDSHNQELTMDELIEMHEQDIKEHESKDPAQSEDRMAVGNLTEGLSLIVKGLNILENTDSNEKHIFSTKLGTKRLLACYEEILWEKKNTPLSR
ncbi:tigger transposable element-derived protein 1 [Trichonephila clavipes]|nr:tigger transposable element-derived protein 1 [Trichonephila clavipes]